MNPERAKFTTLSSPETNSTEQCCQIYDGRYVKKKGGGWQWRYYKYPCGERATGWIRVELWSSDPRSAGAAIYTTQLVPACSAHIWEKAMESDE